MKIKKIIAGIMALTMCVGFIGNPAFSENFNTVSVNAEETGKLENGLIYTLYDNYAEITGCDISVKSVEIPAEIEGLPVKKIGDMAFYDCKEMTSITIPDSVTGIGIGAFGNCEGLTSITIPDSVTNIEKYAFAGCTGLTSITIPDSITIIRVEVFYGCTGLTSITIPDSVTSIGDGAFYLCMGLTSITIPDSVTSIGKQAFGYFRDEDGNYETVSDFIIYGHSGTASETYAEENGFEFIELDGEEKEENIDNRLQYKLYDDYAEITGCDESAETIEIPAKIEGLPVKSIGSKAFYFCTGLTSITIPDSVTSIGSSAFAYCVGLTSITIPDGVEFIGVEVFYGCTGLTSITIPDSVTKIGKQAFGYFRYEHGDYETVSNFIIYGHSGTAAETYAEENGFEFIELDSEEEEENIDNRLQYKLYDDYAEITGCDKSAEKIEIPAEIEGLLVKKIGNEAFSGCEGLTSITIPDSVTSIECGAFYGCTGLTLITIPDSVEFIGYYAFENTAWYENQPDGVVYIGKVAYKYKGEMPENTHIEIKDGTKCISDYAFSGFGYYWTISDSILKSVKLPESIVYIGNSAFSNCMGLTEINIPNNVEYIGEGAFCNCGLDSITIPQSVKEIGEFSFAYYESPDEGGYYEEFIMYGYKGTAAEKYAKEHNLKFIALDGGYKRKRGDVNGDDEVNARDALAILQDVAKTAPLTSSQRDAADLDGDGEITAGDALKVLQIVVGIEK